MKHKKTATCTSRNLAVTASNEEQGDGEESIQEQGDREVHKQIETDNIPLEEGMVVACYVPSYADEEPQIGSILSISDGLDEVLIEWMSGTYSEPWTVCKKKEGRSYTTWKENISTSMVLFPIQLSQSRRISGALKTKLQCTYAQVRGN